MYKKNWLENGLRFTQAMDTEDDAAYYHDSEGRLLMKVDSGGTAYDGQGNCIGEFRLRTGGGDSWKYVPENGPEIVTPWWNLFDRVEPFVVGQLFGKGSLSEVVAK